MSALARIVAVSATLVGCLGSALALTSQTITFAALSGKTFGDAPFTVSATASSGLPVTFSSQTAAVCTVSGATVTIIAAGSCTVRASQAGDATYAAAPNVDRTFTVAKAAQTITFGALGGKTFGDAPFAVSATASSGLAVTFTSTTTTICTVSGSTVTIVAAGTCTLRAAQAGNGNYNAATNVSQSFTVAKASQTITFGTLPGLRMDQVPTALSATASSGLAVAFTSATTTICTVSGTTMTLKAVGTCTINANQAGNANYLAATQVARSFTVSKGNQTITFGALANKTYKDPNFSVSATASSALAVTFSSTTTTVCTVSGSTVTLVAAGTCTLRAAQAGNTNWNAATNVDQSFTVAKAAQTITFAALSAKPLGSAPFTVTATASSALAVTFSSTTTSTCTASGTTVTLVAMGVCTIQANQAGNANYLAAPAVSQSFSVTAATQTITFPTLTPRLWGSSPFTISATASSGLPVSFFSQSPGVCSVTGNTVTLQGVGTCVVEAYQDGNANNAAAYAARTFPVIKPIQFADAVGYPQPGLPSAIANADFNGDGRTDIVINAPLSVFPGNPDGTFGTRVPGRNDVDAYLVRRIVTGDFNRDGKQDAAVLINHSDGMGQVWVFLSNGPNSFGPGTIAYTGWVSGIASADLDGDGAHDLLIGGYSGVATLLADGTGGFRVGPGPLGPGASIAIGDFNNDGKPDALVAGRDVNQYCIALGRGDGTFSSTTCASVADGPAGIVIGDFNGDGNADFGLIKSVPDANYSIPISIYLGKGNGTFYAPTDFIAQDFDIGPDVTLAAGDFNGDGRVDIVVAGSSITSVMTGAGDGTFFAPIRVLLDPFSPSVVVADLNGDGRSDLVLTGGGVSGISVLLALDAAPSSGTIVPQTGTPQSAAVGSTYATLFSALVRNGAGQPVANQQVLFSAPTAGPSGTFYGGATTATVATQSNGVAVAPPFAANAIAGAYAVQASTGTSSTTFALTNTDINQQPPAFVSGPPVAGSVGVAYSFLVIATGNPAPTISALGNSLPTGLSLNGGLISGTPSTAGTFVGQLSATNGVNPTATQGFAISISQAVQTISFGPLPGRLFSTTPFAVSATASSGLPVTFTSTTASVCTVSGNMVTLLTTGTCTVRASQNGDSVFAAAAPVSQNTIVSKANQTIVFGELADRVLSSGSFGLSATASSGLAVTFTSLTTGVCTVSGVTVTLVTTGTCTVSAAQTGSTLFNAATTISRTFVVRPAGTNQQPTIAFVAPATGDTYTAPAIVPMLVSTADSDGAIVRVEFYSGTNLVGIASTSPYRLVWTDVPAGTYSLTAKAIDNLGAVTTSSAASITVSAASPPLAFARIDTPLPAATTSIDVADLNADGKADLALITDCLDCKIRVYKGNGAGGFSQWSATGLPVNSYLGTATRLADLNGDGRPDLVTLYLSYATLSVSIVNADGTLNAPASYSLAAPARSVTAADFTGDGKSDLAVALSDGSIALLSGNGNGTLQAAATAVSSVGQPTSIASGDFNGDGKSDLVLTDFSAGSIRLIRGNGNGTFQAPVTIATTTEPGDSPYRLVVADLNGDGKLDVAFSNFYEPYVTVVLGNGDGSFQPPVDYPAGNFPSGLSVGDLNGDGKKDLVVANESESGTVSVLLGNGNGTFQAPQVLSVGTMPGVVAAIDLTGDGKVDIVADSGDAFVTALVNIQGVATSAPVFTNAPPPSAMAAQAYSFQFTASGVPAPTFSLTPQGATGTFFSLSSDGRLTGTPGVGLYSGTVRATNGIAPDATYAFSFAIRAPVTTFDFTLPAYALWPDCGICEIQLDSTLGYQSLTPTICSMKYVSGPDYTPGGTPRLVPEGIGVCTVRGYLLNAPNGTIAAPPIERSMNVLASKPMVAITLPADHVHMSPPATINVVVDALDYNGIYKGSDTGIPYLVNVAMDGGPGCTATARPFTCTIVGVGAGNHTLVANSYIQLTAFGTQQYVSQPVIVHVQGTSDIAATSITSPPTDAQYFAPATIPFSVLASDPNSSIVKVEFYNGPQLIGTAGTPPYNFNWTGVPTGTYVITARGVSASGLVTVSPGITVNVASDTAPPAAFFDFNVTWDSGTFVKDAFYGFILQKSGAVTQVAAPAAGAKQDTCKAALFAGGTLDTESFPVASDVGAKTGVAFWMYWNGGNSAMPFSWQSYGLLFLNGHFGFTTSGTDVYGIASTGLANGWHHVFAEFTNGSVTGNRLYIDGVAQALTQRTGTPILASANTSSSWRLGGKVGSASFPFAGQLDEVVVVYGPVSPIQATSRASVSSPCAPLTVTLLAPTNNASFVPPAAINLTAGAASDGGLVYSIEFYNGSQILNSSSGSSATFQWRGVAAGTYTITAKARDTLGRVATSAPVTVSVVEPTPHATIAVETPGAVAYADGTVQIAAKPNMDPGYEIQRVNIYIDGSLVLYTSLTDYIWQGKLASGTHVVVTEVIDKFGNKLRSSPYTINVLPSGPSVVYYHNDASGSPLAATDQDGNLYWQQYYEPFGRRETSDIGSSNGIGYTGKPIEDSTGLQYFGARWYSPQIGRFMSVDPESFKETNPKSFNRYAYSNNNPFRYVDPDGHEPVPLNEDQVRYLYGSRDGGGHHVFPRETAVKYADKMSPETVEFASRQKVGAYLLSRGTEGDPHKWGREHIAFNNAMNDVTKQFIASNNISASNPMTITQFKELMDQARRHPDVARYGAKIDEFIKTQRALGRGPTANEILRGTGPARGATGAEE